MGAGGEAGAGGEPARGPAPPEVWPETRAEAGAAEGSDKGAMAGGAGAVAALGPSALAPLTGAHPQFLGLHTAQPPACHGVGKRDL